GTEDTIAHARNFLDCVKSRSKCNADVLIGHVSTATTLLGNIAHKTSSLLEWDERAERVTNSEAANRLLSCKYRPPYKLGYLVVFLDLLQMSLGRSSQWFRG